jgi:hypothetical protein
VTNQAPTAVSDPVISGNTLSGSTLSVSLGTWQGFPAPSYRYQWFSCST